MAGGAPVSHVGMSNQIYYTKAPARCICAFCGSDVSTKTIKQVGLGTWLISFGCCIVGCIPCCLIPFCVEDLQDTVHICPACGQVVGRKDIV